MQRPLIFSYLFYTPGQDIKWYNVPSNFYGTKTYMQLNKYLFCMDFFSQEDLYKILKAYTIHNPRDGYCQAMAPIAAVLLMHMPAEQAFWCFVSICEKYVQGYYSPGLVWSALFLYLFLFTVYFIWNIDSIFSMHFEGC